jgi:hypothetical protein
MRLADLCEIKYNTALAKKWIGVWIFTIKKY